MFTAQQIFGLSIVLFMAVAASAGALWYVRNVAIERPPIGRFDGRDIPVLAVFVMTLPLLYALLPVAVIGVTLAITFLSAGLTTVRPLAGPRIAWLVVPALLFADIFVTGHVDDVPGGVQVYWVLNSVIVLTAAIGIAFFELEGRPLYPAAGFQSGGQFASLGLGDALIFSLYTAAAYKGFGRRGAIVAAVMVAVTGAVVPIALVITAPDFVTNSVGDFFPVQTIFAPAAFCGWKWLARGGPERTTRQWLAAAQQRPAVARARVGLAPTAGAVAALLVVTLFSSGANPAVGQTTPGGAVEIAMRQVRFVPERAVVHVGQTVRWTNRDFLPHDAVATAGAGFRSELFSHGHGYSWRAQRPGTVTYLCTIHKGMTGTLIVED